MLYQTYLKIHIMYMLYNFKINETCSSSTQQKIISWNIYFLFFAALPIFSCLSTSLLRIRISLRIQTQEKPSLLTLSLKQYPEIAK